LYEVVACTILKVDSGTVRVIDEVARDIAVLNAAVRDAHRDWSAHDKVPLGLRVAAGRAMPLPGIYLDAAAVGQRIAVCVNADAVAQNEIVPATVAAQAGAGICLGMILIFFITTTYMEQSRVLLSILAKSVGLRFGLQNPCSA